MRLKSLWVEIMLIKIFCNLIGEDDKPCVIFRIEEDVSIGKDELYLLSILVKEISPC